MCDKLIAYFAIIVWPAHQPILGFAIEWQRDVIFIFCSGNSTCVQWISYLCKLWPTYWQQKSCVWPRLSLVAKSLLGVLAAITVSERAFSVAGRLYRTGDASFIQTLLMDFCLYTDWEIHCTCIFSLYATDCYFVVYSWTLAVRLLIFS